jgi:hypothetical protein
VERGQRRRRTREFALRLTQVEARLGVASAAVSTGLRESDDQHGRNGETGENGGKPSHRPHTVADRS